MHNILSCTTHKFRVYFPVFTRGWIAHSRYYPEHHPPSRFSPPPGHLPPLLPRGSTRFELNFRTSLNHRRSDIILSVADVSRGAFWGLGRSRWELVPVCHVSGRCWIGSVFGSRTRRGSPSIDVAEWELASWNRNILACIVRKRNRKRFRTCYRPVAVGSSINYTVTGTMCGATWSGNVRFFNRTVRRGPRPGERRRHARIERCHWTWHVACHCRILLSEEQVFMPERGRIRRYTKLC